MKPLDIAHIRQATLSALLKENSLFEITRLKPEHFGEYAIIYQAMKKLYEDNGAVDQVLLIGELYDELPSIGGLQVVTKIAKADTNVSNFQAYEKELIEHWQLNEIKRLQKREITSLDDAIEIKSKLDDLTTLEDDDEYNHQQELMDLHREIEEQTEGLSGYDTGFTDLNEYLDGLQEEDLIIIAARPSMGKTALALNLANNHALNKQRTIFFSLEMPKRQLQKRMISSIGKINGSRMRNPNARFNDEDWTKYHKALGIYGDYKLHIYDKSGQTVEYIRSKVQQIRNDYPNDELLVVIDYLQLMRSSGSHENRNIEVSEISRSLKELARDEKIPVVVLSQLSRGVEQRQDKRPMLSDLRDSGAVEQDADVVMFLFRDDYYNEGSEKENITEIIISKQRNGPIGTVELYFDKEHSRFMNLARDHHT